jgi:hypothetical protein
MRSVKSLKRSGVPIRNSIQIFDSSFLWRKQMSTAVTKKPRKVQTQSPKLIPYPGNVTRGRPDTFAWKCDRDLIADLRAGYGTRVTVHDLAELFDVAPSTIRAWVKRGRLHEFCDDDSQSPARLFARDEVIQAIKDQIELNRNGQGSKL